MCGIIGRVGGAPTAWDPRTLASLRHRGPDAQSEALIGGVQLGHTRLSIIDLAGGDQPMSDVDGLATIVFNGEIYNYAALRSELEARGQRFATRSDTEAILGAYLAWGVAGFARLRGMYALALHDHRDGSTILARDPFGIKPLFVAKAAGAFHFASEQAALLDMMGIEPELDPTSILETLVHRHPFGTHSLYKGVERLAPGVALIIAAGGETAREQRFTSLPDAVEACRAELGTPTARDAESRVRDSIAHHAIADVPVGCFLSGGLDSSIVAATLAADAKGKLQAYSVGFAAAASEISELPYARLVADAAGIDLHEVSVTPADFADLAPILSGTRNGPFPDHADIAMLKLSFAARRDVKVVLTGEGSDEAFAGYPKYAADRYARLLGLPMRLADPLLRRRGRLGIAASALAEPRRPQRWLRWFQSDEAPAPMLQALIAAGADPERAPDWVAARAAAYPSAWSDMQRMQLLDLESWLPNNLLHRGDYTTMQASLEQRVPLLDIQLTPWAVALPDDAKVRGLDGKRILKRAFADRLPPAILKRRKSGFRLPLGEWLAGHSALRDMASDHLLVPNAALRQFLPRAGVEAMLAPAALATTGGAKLAWTSLCLELWMSAAADAAAQAARAAE